jgi:hypothetical protein
MLSPVFAEPHWEKVMRGNGQVTYTYKVEVKVTNTEKTAQEWSHTVSV